MNTVPKEKIQEILSVANELWRKGMADKRKSLIRDSIIIKMYVLSGISTQELRHVIPEDCLVGNGRKYIRITKGKWGKERFVEIPYSLKSDLLKYLQWKNDNGEIYEGCYLLRSERGHRYLSTGLWRRWHNYFPDITLATIRNTYGQLLAYSVHDMEFVRKQLGLSRRSTASLYFENPSHGNLGHKESNIKKFGDYMTDKKADNEFDFLKTLVPIKKKNKYLYFIECEGVYKIGISDSPAKRVCGLQTANPFPVRLKALITTDNVEKLETDLHYEFREFQASGEWFKISDQTVKDILGRFSSDTVWSVI